MLRIDCLAVRAGSHQFVVVHNYSLSAVLRSQLVIDRTAALAVGSSAAADAAHAADNQKIDCTADRLDNSVDQSSLSTDCKGLTLCVSALDL